MMLPSDEVDLIRAFFIMEQEIWKDFPEYEGKFKVSNLGRIKSHIKRKDWIIVGHPAAKGYLRFSIGVNKYVLIHRAVGITFIPNPENKPHINHKNGVKNDNRIDNLEWCSASENTLHSYRILGRILPWSNKKGKLFHKIKKINQYSMDGTFIKEWYNARDITRELGFSHANISAVCHNRRKSCGGYIWRFTDTNPLKIGYIIK